VCGAVAELGKPTLTTTGRGGEKEKSFLGENDWGRGKEKRVPKGIGLSFTMEKGGGEERKDAPFPVSNEKKREKGGI